jgi:hypothetical protein
MHLSWSITALLIALRFRYCQSVIVAAPGRGSPRCAKAHRVHVLREAVGHLLDDLEAERHRRRAHLDVARRRGDEVERVAPVGEAADARDTGQAAVSGSRPISAVMCRAIA